MAVRRTVNRPAASDPVARRYLCSPLPPPGLALLPESVSSHLLVVRARAGESIRLFDGAGRECEARLERVERRAITAQIGAAEAITREPALRLELAVALPKGARAEWLFEHGTELGIARFRPLVFARSQSGARDGRRARWERIVRAACEQCDRSHLPLVDDETELAALLRDRELPDARFAAVPGAVTALTPPGTRAALLLVGPEGGLTDAERAALAEAGFQACSLGALTLRTETAALVGAARLLA
jgi:16S rRNA (uracil1498-N3)-methyltransferase